MLTLYAYEKEEEEEEKDRRENKDLWNETLVRIERFFIYFVPACVILPTIYLPLIYLCDIDI